MFFSKKFSFFLGIALSFASAINAKDLEEIAQDFVLETRKIAVPDCPHAFNPSIIKWKGRWLMSFRIVADSKHVSPICSASESDVGMIWLDDDFNPVGKPQFLFLDHPQKKRPYLLAEDVRLITWNEKLYIVYSANKEAEITDEGFRMYVAELDFDEESFFVVSNECLSSFDGADPNRREKNWVPFVYENKLLLAYSLFPHKIFSPLLDGSEHCETIASRYPSLIWEWGELRGGTPAVRINEEYYLAFFHSSISLKTVHSGYKPMPHYFIGAYLFSSAPPFEIKHISPEPIIGNNFYHGETYEPYWSPVCVVFPCGLIVNDNALWIVYGRQDHEIWIAKLDRQELLDGLIHVSTLLD